MASVHTGWGALFAVIVVGLLGGGMRTVESQPYIQFGTMLSFEGPWNTNTFDSDTTTANGLTLSSAPVYIPYKGSGTTPWALTPVVAGNDGTTYMLRLTDVSELEGQAITVFAFAWGVASKAATDRNTFLAVHYFRNGISLGYRGGSLPYSFATDHSVPTKAIGMFLISEIPGGFQHNDYLGLVVHQGPVNTDVSMTADGNTNFPAGISWGLQTGYVQYPGTNVPVRTYGQQWVFTGTAGIELSNDQSEFGGGFLHALTGSGAEYNITTRETFSDLGGNTPWLVHLVTNAQYTEFQIVEIVFQSSASLLSGQMFNLDITVSGQTDSNPIGAIYMQAYLRDGGTVISQSPRVLTRAYTGNYVMFNQQYIFAGSDLTATRTIRIIFNTAQKKDTMVHLTNAEINLVMTTSAHTAA